MSEWQPIETAPKDGTHIDISALNNSGERCRLPDCWMDGGEWRGNYIRPLYGPYKPTHWMSIPANPAQPEEKA